MTIYQESLHNHFLKQGWVFLYEYNGSCYYKSSEGNDRLIVESDGTTNTRYEGPKITITKKDLLKK